MVLVADQIVLFYSKMLDAGGDLGGLQDLQHKRIPLSLAILFTVCTLLVWQAIVIEFTVHFSMFLRARGNEQRQPATSECYIEQTPAVDVFEDLVKNLVRQSEQHWLLVNMAENAVL